VVIRPAQKNTRLFTSLVLFEHNVVRMEKLIDTGRLLKYVVFFYNTLSSTLWPNRAASRTHMDAYKQSLPFWIHHFQQSPREENFTLKTLAVHPAFQGKGYGKRLVEWGLDRAMNQGVAAGVITAAVNEGFYRNCGFDVKIGEITEGENNPLSGEIDGTILFRYHESSNEEDAD